MTLDDIIYNLDNTIAGKSSLKEALERHGPAFARLLEINISELKAIRADVIKVKTAVPPTMDE